VLMASGYPYPSGSSSTTYLIDATAWAGALPSVSGPGATISGSGGCDSSTGQEFTVLADVAVARDYSKGGTRTCWPPMWRTPGGRCTRTRRATARSWIRAVRRCLRLSASATLLACGGAAESQQPEQRNGNSVYLVQVTNSVLDPITVAYSSGKFPASKLVVGRLTSIGANPPTLDQTLHERFDSASADATGANHSVVSRSLASWARRLTVAQAEACCPRVLGPQARRWRAPFRRKRFQIFTTWYTPRRQLGQLCWIGLTNGNSYVTLHEFLSNGTWRRSTACRSSTSM